jgi:metal-responsive CopG/Arc/MetJ family transcriptional regulator
MMKTIQMTIDEELLQEVDTAVDNLGTSRSAFMREALQQALRQMRIASLERQHVAGYEQYPVNPGEFDIWQTV